MKIWNFIKPYLLAVGISFAIMGIVLWILGYDVAKAFETLITVPFSSNTEIIETLKKFVPLLLVTYAFSIPFKIRLFNIGGFGQMLFGGAMTAVVGLMFPQNTQIPAIIMITLLIGVALAAGGFFAFVAGWLKVKYNIDPIISTIMLNFVGLEFVAYITTTHPWKAELSGHPMTKMLPKPAWLPNLFSNMHIGLLFALILIFLVYIFMKRSKLGYEITAVGYNPTSSGIYGIDINKTIILTFVLGGALAGLAGGIEVMGVHHRLLEGFAHTSGAEYGVFGILTSLICKGDPIGIPITAFFISYLLIGADAMQRSLQVPVEIVFITQALLVIFIVATRLRAQRS